MNIVTVCGMGSGSSLLLKMNIDKVLKKAGLDVKVSAMDLGSVGGADMDMIVSTTGLESQLERYDVDKVFVTNVMDSKFIEENVLPLVKEKLEGD